MIAVTKYIGYLNNSKKDMIIFNGAKYNASEINILSNQLANALIKKVCKKLIEAVHKEFLESVITLFGIQSW